LWPGGVKNLEQFRIKNVSPLAGLNLQPFYQLPILNLPRFLHPPHCCNHNEAFRGGEGMSATATQANSSYLLRKLHSLTGIIPVGAFLAEHFWSNSAALVSAQKYNQTSEDLQTIPYRLFVEWAFIFLPILYHGGYGVYIWLRGQSNVSQYPWVRNWLYALQRWTGLVAFVYIGWHLYTERWITHGRSTYATVAYDLRNPWYLAFFIVGVLASSFHLGVGIWNFLCKWGLAATARAQRAAGQLGVLVGVTFSVVGVLIILSFRLDWHPFASYLTK
jgi:succinate dehydrogenase / fumarate reductase, cytochrome b subunit